MAPVNPLVSVVVPCFARTARDVKLLEETLASVDAQTCQDFEIVVVDDGSPRDIAGVAQGRTNISLHRQANAGSAVARNTAITASRGRYLVFLDADDLLLPGALETGVQHLQEHPECGFAIGPREEMTYEGEPVPWEVPVPPPGTDIYTALLNFDWYIIPPSSAMFRRDVVVEVGGFQDPWGADDLDFYLRVARAYPAWCYQAPAVTRYRRYSASSSRDGERMLRSIRAVYARQWPHVSGSETGRQGYRSGLARLTDIFTDCLVENIADRVGARNWRGAARSAITLARERPHKLLSAVKEVRTRSGADTAR